jgi:hypothetical protein
MTVELACSQASPRVPQALNFGKVGSPDKTWQQHACCGGRKYIIVFFGEVELETPTDNFSHLYLATYKASWMDMERRRIP